MAASGPEPARGVPLADEDQHGGPRPGANDGVVERASPRGLLDVCRPFNVGRVFGEPVVRADQVSTDRGRNDVIESRQLHLVGLAGLHQVPDGQGRTIQPGREGRWCLGLQRKTGHTQVTRIGLARIFTAAPWRTRAALCPSPHLPTSHPLPSERRNSRRFCF